MTMQPWPSIRRNLIAILRGIHPTEVEGVISVLIEEGFEAIEIPLNSPDPFESIARAVGHAGGKVLIGAGTVLNVTDVEKLANVGGRLVVSPNVDVAVLGKASELGLISMPGVMSPTEAFSALSHGASALKFFPANVLGATGISAMRAVLPRDTIIGAVGGVSDKDFQGLRAAGVTAFGLGASLFKPSLSLGDLRERARHAIQSYDVMVERQ